MTATSLDCSGLHGVAAVVLQLTFASVNNVNKWIDSVHRNARGLNILFVYSTSLQNLALKSMWIYLVWYSDITSSLVVTSDFICSGFETYVWDFLPFSPIQWKWLESGFLFSGWATNVTVNCVNFFKWNCSNKCPLFSNCTVNQVFWDVFSTWNQNYLHAYCTFIH